MMRRYSLVATRRNIRSKRDAIMRRENVPICLFWARFCKDFIAKKDMPPPSIMRHRLGSVWLFETKHLNIGILSTPRWHWSLQVTKGTEKVRKWNGTIIGFSKECKPGLLRCNFNANLLILCRWLWRGNVIGFLGGSKGVKTIILFWTKKEPTFLKSHKKCAIWRNLL